MNALHRHEEERVEEVLQNLRAKGIRITDARRAVLSFLFSGESWTSKRWEDLSRFIASVSKHESSNCLQQYQGFDWWGGVVSEIKVRNDTTTYFDFISTTIWMWCVKNVVISQMWISKSRSSWRSSQSKWLPDHQNPDDGLWHLPWLSEKLMWE